MSISTIHDILAQFREEARNNRHLGDCFERLVARYLQLDPLFADRFSNVWMWNERPINENTGGLMADKTRIIYNSHTTLEGIPLEAYDYAVNGKPALEWIIERYQITIDKASAIKNDPNDWCQEHNNPRYIVDLIKRVTQVSLETMKIVNALPALNERGA